MPQEMPGVAAAGGLVGARLARLLHREEAPLVAATRPDLRTREGAINKINKCTFISAQGFDNSTMYTNYSSNSRNVEL